MLDGPICPALPIAICLFFLVIQPITDSLNRERSSFPSKLSRPFHSKSSPMCLNTENETYQRVHVVFVVTQNGIPFILQDPIWAHGFQVQYITFKNVPADALGSTFVVSCPQLQITQHIPAMVVQAPPYTSVQRFVPAVVTWPQALINDHQEYPLCCFEEERYLRNLAFTIGNEEVDYDATSINTFSRFTIGIDFFVQNKGNCS